MVSRKAFGVLLCPKDIRSVARRNLGIGILQERDEARRELRYCRHLQGRALAEKRERRDATMPGNRWIACRVSEALRGNTVPDAKSIDSGGPRARLEEHVEFAEGLEDLPSDLVGPHAAVALVRR